MKPTRLLLPFTHGIDMDVLEYAVLLAKGRDATLVPLSLIHIPKGRRSGGARLEQVQQSKDFLEAIKHKAAFYDVPIERFEIFTGDVVESINIHAQNMDCADTLLFVRDGNGILLQTDEIKHLMEQPTCKLSIIRLPSKAGKRFTWTLPEWLFNWLPGRRGKQDEPLQVQHDLEAEVRLPFEREKAN